jgi:hypothetical protein
MVSPGNGTTRVSRGFLAKITIRLSFLGMPWSGSNPSGDAHFAGKYGSISDRPRVVGLMSAVILSVSGRVAGCGLVEPEPAGSDMAVPETSQVDAQSASPEVVVDATASTLPFVADAGSDGPSTSRQRDAGGDALESSRERDRRSPGMHRRGHRSRRRLHLAVCIRGDMRRIRHRRQPRCPRGDERRADERRGRLAVRHRAAPRARPLFHRGRYVRRRSYVHHV